MDSTSIVLLCVIVLYLLFAFIQSRWNRRQSPVPEQDQTREHAVTAEGVGDESEFVAIAAVVAAIMGESSYSIRRIYPVPVTDEKVSSWKTTGRNESMMRRVFFRT